jgi:hypothetical protein
MTTNVRTFLRNFAAYKSKARQGETVRVKDGDGEFVFTASTPRRSLLGAAKGRIAIHGDLAEPTLRADDWRPST